MEITDFFPCTRSRGCGVWGKRQQQIQQVSPGKIMFGAAIPAWQMREGNLSQFPALLHSHPVWHWLSSPQRTQHIPNLLPHPSSASGTLLCLTVTVWVTPSPEGGFTSRGISLLSMSRAFLQPSTDKIFSQNYSELLTAEWERQLNSPDTERTTSIWDQQSSRKASFPWLEVNLKLCFMQVMWNVWRDFFFLALYILPFLDQRYSIIWL